MDLRRYIDLIHTASGCRYVWQDGDEYKPYRYGYWTVTEPQVEDVDYSLVSKYRMTLDDEWPNKNNSTFSKRRKQQEEEIEMLPKDEFLEAYQNMVF